MEEAVVHLIVSEDQQIEVSLNQHSARTSSGEISYAFRKTIDEIIVDNTLVKEHLEKPEMMFQLILSDFRCFLFITLNT